MGWKKYCVAIFVEHKHFQFLHTKIQHQDGKEWFFTPVYMSQREKVMKDLWDNIECVVHRVGELAYKRKLQRHFDSCREKKRSRGFDSKMQLVSGSYKRMQAHSYSNLRSQIYVEMSYL